MPYALPDLPYAYDALEPHIDAQTMEIHHSKHHNTYVANLNAAVEGTEYDGTAIEELVEKVETLPDRIRKAVRNNGGGHANHSLFWTVMSPKGGGQPQGEVAKRIDSDLGGFDKFKQQFTEAAKALIIDRGFDPVYGARPLKRYLQSSAETLIAKKILSGDLPMDATLVVDERDGELVCEVRELTA